MEIRSIGQATGKELLEKIKKDHIEINVVDTGRLFKLCKECANNLTKQARYQPNNSYAKDLYCYSFNIDSELTYYLVFEMVVYNYNGNTIGGLGFIYYAGTNMVMASKVYNIAKSN